MVDEPEKGFASTYRKKPAVAPRGLLPGRRVFTSMGWGVATAVVVSLSVVAAGAVLGGDGDPDTTLVSGTLEPTPEQQETEPAEPAAPTEEETEEAAEEPTEEEEPPVEEEAPVVQEEPDPEPEIEEEEQEEEVEEEDTGAESGTALTETIQGPEPVDGQTYRLISGLGTCLDRSNGLTDPGTAVQSFGCNDGDAQRFTLHEVGRDLWMLQSGNVCVGVQDASQDMGGDIRMYTCNESMSQRWSLTEVGDGYFELAAGHSKYCMDVENGKSESWTNVRQWDCNQARAQQWKFEAF
ncbi:RICIN domain-containing protein [Streptomyces sp. RFCAC02]|uniref:RICIN domain-containing protein n=1 Tax=Streptomyces sp. RFCAC02 TaxID=2499143 RepID=UPI001021DA8C|nr:RICIN domain-containing protein [Streptomyces sp. RFCAC02]